MLSHLIIARISKASEHHACQVDTQDDRQLIYQIKILCDMDTARIMTT